jgi:hypothetical protein
VKVGDQVTCGDKEGKIIRFQPKTQDVIVLDENGEVLIFSQLRVEVKSGRL